MAGHEDRTTVCRERVVDGVVILSLGRSLRGPGEAGLRERIDEFAQLGRTQILIDLSELPYIDSTELGRLIRCHLSVRSAGGRVRLCNVSGQVISLLRMSRLDTVLDFYATEEEALTAIRGAAAPAPQA